MPSKSKKLSLPSFANPPLVEVVMGAQFAKIERFTAVHLGELWESLGKKDFPEIQEHPLLQKVSISPEPVISLLVGGNEWPRIWFVSPDKSTLIQFQKDRFLYNWRENAKATYPRYQEMLSKFLESYGKLQKCLVKAKASPLRLESLELTYVNLIPLKAIDKVSHLGKIFKDLDWKKGKRFLDSPSRINLFWQFVVPSNKAIARIHLISAQSIQDGEEVLKFEMSVHGQVGGDTTQEIKNWFSSSHEWLVNAFVDLTTQEMHKLWRISYEK